MLCCNCGVNVPPEWKKIILENICPNCSKEIVNGSMRELLDELKGALEKMPADPEGLAGWLLSNYQLIKIGTGKPVTNFYGGKAQVMMSDNNEEGNVVVRVREGSEFTKRAGVKQNPKLEELARQVKERFGAPERNIEDVDPDYDPDPEYTAAALAVMDETVNNPGVANTSEVQVMANEFSMMYGDSQTNKDISHPSVQNERMARLARQQGLSGGDKVGLIKRKD